MTDGRPHPHRRKVTRGYVGGLIAATIAVAIALLIAGWGGISFFSGGQPVSSAGVSVFAGELIVLFAIIMLGWGLWRQALVLLRGRQSPPWANILVLTFGAYFIWCVGGLIAGLSIEETWLSPFALAMAVAWGLCSLLFWAVLARRVYTDRPVPKWPWERSGKDELGPDWITPDQWASGRGSAGGAETDDDNRDGYDGDDDDRGNNGGRER